MHTAVSANQQHLSVDGLILTVRQGQLTALLSRRTSPPFEGQWALPGRLVALDESADEAASRLLTEFPAPGNTLAEAQETAEQKAERGLISEEESRAFDLQRRRNALQYQLREAVDAENYEEAARLRDELRALPQN